MKWWSQCDKIGSCYSNMNSSKIETKHQNCACEMWNNNEITETLQKVNGDKIPKRPLVYNWRTHF